MRSLLRAVAVRLRSQRGFTLVEMMVALVAGIVVTAAMGSIVVSSVHFNSNITDRVDANQQGRLAMEKIIQALNSSCVAAGQPPIVSSSPNTSDGTHLFFYSALADTATIAPNLIELSLANNTLVMSTFANTNPTGTPPAKSLPSPWTFNTTAASNFTLLPFAVQQPGTPIFQYYGYTAGSGTISSTAFSTPLAATDASNTAEVVVSFRALPSDNWNAQGRAADLSDTVVLRLTPASATGNPPNNPCA